MDRDTIENLARDLLFAIDISEPKDVLLARFTEILQKLTRPSGPEPLSRRIGGDVCPTCNGYGNGSNGRCSTCYGTGLVAEQPTLPGADATVVPTPEPFTREWFVEDCLGDHDHICIGQDHGFGQCFRHWLRAEVLRANSRARGLQ
jgi:hypothetical protein